MNIRPATDNGLTELLTELVLIEVAISQNGAVDVRLVRRVYHKRGNPNAIPDGPIIDALMMAAQQPHLVLYGGAGNTVLADTRKRLAREIAQQATTPVPEDVGGWFDFRSKTVTVFTGGNPCQ